MPASPRCNRISMAAKLASMWPESVLRNGNRTLLLQSKFDGRPGGQLGMGMVREAFSKSVPPLNA